MGSRPAGRDRVTVDALDRSGERGRGRGRGGNRKPDQVTAGRPITGHRHGVLHAATDHW